MRMFHGMMMSVPGSLSSRERVALDVLLAAEFSGVSEPRAQAGSAVASGDGLIIDLVVDQSLPRCRGHAPCAGRSAGQ